MKCLDSIKHQLEIKELQNQIDILKVEKRRLKAQNTNKNKFKRSKSNRIKKAKLKIFLQNNFVTSNDPKSTLLFICDLNLSVAEQEIANGIGDYLKRRSGIWKRLVESRNNGMFIRLNKIHYLRQFSF